MKRRLFIVLRPLESTGLARLLLAPPTPLILSLALGLHLDLVRILPLVPQLLFADPLHIPILTLQGPLTNHQQHVRRGWLVQILFQGLGPSLALE